MYDAESKMNGGGVNAQWGRLKWMLGRARWTATSAKHSECANNDRQELRSTTRAQRMEVKMKETETTTSGRKE